MKNFPKIAIKEDIKEEIELFINFLDHPDFPQHRNFILGAFPELKFLLSKSKKDEKIAVSNFVRNFHKEHKANIRKIILEDRSILKKKGRVVLQKLAEMMDYQWPKPITYIAMPTTLPFSPFGNNIFYFSILRRIREKRDSRVLYIATHEISHFIFFDLLKKIEKKNKFKLPKDALYYLKEALTTALINQAPLRDLLGIKEDVGNQEIHDIYINKSGEKPKIIRDFIQEFYIQKTKKERKSFESFLDELIKIFILIAPAISKKRLIWNRYGRTLIGKPRILARYRKPVPIK